MRQRQTVLRHTAPFRVEPASVAVNDRAAEASVPEPDGPEVIDVSGAVVSADVERARSVARRVRTGTIGVNGGIFYSPDVPFGGYKQSGIGREMGVAGFEEYLEIKSIAEGI